jgi:putative DNA methylase
VTVAKELAFLLFSIAEDRKMTKVATQFNELGTSWNAIVTAARRGPGIPRQYSEQLAFDVTREHA